MTLPSTQDRKKLKNVLVGAFNRQSLAHLCIDLQGRYYTVSDHHVYASADRLAQSCRPHIPNIWITMRTSGDANDNAPIVVTPDEGEQKLYKTSASAFSSTMLKASLETQGIDTVLISGVDARCCIASTIREALQHSLNVVPVIDAINLMMPRYKSARELYGEQVIPASVNDITKALKL